MDACQSDLMPQSNGPAPAPPLGAAAGRKRLLALFSLVACAIAGVGYAYYRHEAKWLSDERRQDLRAIADLKVNQFVHWRNERNADAQAYAKAPSFRNAVSRWLKTPDDAALRGEIVATLEALSKSHGYSSMILANPEGQVLAAANPQRSDLESAKKLISAALAAQDAVFGDFFRCAACSEVHVDVAAAIRDTNQRPVAVLILRVNPENELYPLIQSWPLPSATAETLLVRKEGAEVVFLNRLRHHTAPPLTLRIPLSNMDVPAVAAAQGLTGRFDGRDYRGEKVLADVRPVPASPWFIVAKVDQRELLAATRYHGLVTLLFVTLAIVVVGAALLIAFSHRQRALYANLFRAERNRREALEEMRITLYSIGDAVIVTDAEARITQMNPTAELLTGWRESEAVDQPLEQVFRIVNERTRETVANPAARVLREGVVVGLANHTLLVARDGLERPIADSGAPIRNEEGQIIGTVLVFRDQTEQRQAERELYESREKYRITLYSIGDGVIAADNHGCVQQMNSVAEELTGWREAEARGHRLEEVFRIINEDTRATVENPAERVLREGVVVGLANHTLLIARDGVERPIADSGSPIRDSEGQIIGVVLVFRDQTEQREAERTIQADHDNLRAILATSPVALVVLDEREQIVDANPMAERMFGKKLPDMKGRRCGDLAHCVNQHGVFAGCGDSAGCPDCLLAAAIRMALCAGQGTADQEVEFWWHSPEGLRQSWFTLSVEPVVLDGRRHAVLTLVDVTERKNTEMRQRQFEMDLLRAQRLESLGVLAGGIAHDFNNILAGIMGYAELALARIPKLEPARSDLEEIKRASQRAAGLTRQMLAYSGKGKFVVEPVNLSQLVDESKNMLAMAASKKAALKYNLAAGLPAVQADASQIHQVLMNLVINASEALGEHGGAITVSTDTVFCDSQLLAATTLGKDLPAGRYVCLQVADEGCGMDPETVHKIFDPFFTTKFTGRGLGLAAVYGILRGHKGTIHVLSAPGEGTVFRALFPAGGDAAPAVPEAAAAATNWRGSGTVLVVDDEPTVCGMAKKMIEFAGFTTLVASDGEEALRLYRERQQDVVCVLLDLTMPKMDGEEAFRALREVNPDVQVILSSGFDEEGATERFSDMGLAGFLHKPYQLDTLVAALRQAIGGSAAIDPPPSA